MKKLNAFFIGIFLLIISFPLLFLDTESVLSEKENKVFAAFPQIVTQDGRIDTVQIAGFPRLLDTYIGDRFGFRNTLVAFAGTLNSAAKKINGGAVLGKDNWLFLAEKGKSSNINDFFKMNLFSETEVKTFIENIEKRREWCEANNIKFIFLIAPNKHNVYPEYYPFERPGGITRTEQIMAALPENLKDTVIYPLESLLQRKTGQIPLYFETDTHWNMAGAQRVYEILFDRMKRMFAQTNFPEIEFVSEVKYDSSGDIVPYMGLSSYGKRTIPLMRPAEDWKRYYFYKKKEGRAGVITENIDSSLPRAIIFRDSFFTALEPFTSTLFSSAEYNWRHFTCEDAEYILQSKPDILVWEILEKYMAEAPRFREQAGE
jgi:hypothetical protein